MGDAHEPIYWALGIIAALGAGGIGALFMLIMGIRSDHVKREEFTRSLDRLETLAANQSAVMARQQDDRERLVAIERRHCAGGE